MKLASLSFLIPAYKDEETISRVIKQSEKVGKKIADKFRIVVLNDASPDGTGYIINKLKDEIPELKIITHPVNRGYGYTIRQLYRSSKTEWLFSVPGDGQIPPAEVLKLMPYTNQADMIIGKRVNRSDSLGRLRQSRIYNKLLKIMFNLNLTDVNSVRLMREDMVKVIKLDSRSAFVDAELAIRALEEGFKVKEVPIEHQARTGAGGGGGSLKTIIPTVIDMVKFFFIRG